MNLSQIKRSVVTEQEHYYSTYFYPVRNLLLFFHCLDGHLQSLRKWNSVQRRNVLLLIIGGLHPRLSSPTIPFKNIGKAKNVKTAKLSKIKHILS